MNATLVRGLALRWTLRHRLRSVLGLAAVALGVAAFLSSVAVSQAVTRTGSAAAQALGGGADLVVEADETGLPAALVATVHGTPGVAAAAPVVAAWLRVASADGRNVMVVGVDPAAERMMRRRGGADPARGLTLVDPVSFALGRGVVVAKPLADALGLGPSTPLRLHSARGEVTFAVAGTFDVPGAAAGTPAGRVVVLPIGAARSLLARGDRVDRIDLTLADGADPAGVAARVRASVAASAPPSVRVGPPGAADPSIGEVLGAVDVGLKMGALVSLLVGVFLIHHTVAVGVAERRREIGILRSVGATRAQVVGVFCAEALVLGVLGGALGVGLGWLVATTALRGVAGTISGTYFPTEPAPVEVSAGLAAAGLAAGALVALVAAWLPARRAAFDAPTDAIRRGPEDSARRAAIPGVAAVIALGSLAVCAGLVFGPPVPWGGYWAIFALLVSFVASAPLLLMAGARAITPLMARFGVPGRIAAAELARHPRRAALPATALALGLALVVESVGIVVSLSKGTLDWMEQNVSGDAFVSSGSTVLSAGAHTPLDESVVADLARVPGIDHVVGVRTLRLPWRTTRLFILALDIAPFRRMTHLTVRGTDADGRDRARDAILADVETGTSCLVSENLAALHGVAVGDTLTLPAADGTVPMRVAGVFPDYSWPRGTVLMSREVVRVRLRDRLVDQCSIDLAEGLTAAAAAPRIEAALGADRQVVVTSAADFRAAARGLMEDFFRLGYAQVAVSLAVAFLGVLNSLWIAVVMRRREIGLFRAAGATRGQVVASVVLQAAALGALGAVAGIVGGLAVEWIALRRLLLADTGWLAEFVVPWGTLATVAVAAVATSAVAGLFPARAAARTEIRDAIGYE